MPRACRLLICVFLPFVSNQFLISQQPATPLSVLQGALAALGGTNIQTIAMSGNSEYIAGSTNDTGSFSGSCAVGGSSQFSLKLSAGTLTETRQTTNGLPTGTWTGIDGIQHAIAYHNLLTPASWFCPVVALSQVVSNPNLNIQFIGNETKNGANAAHFQVNWSLSGATFEASRLAHLSQVDIYLDTQTFVPLDFDFTIHPDKDSGLDIAVEVRFSNYSQVNGVWGPSTVQRYINSSLALNLQIQSWTPALSQ